MDFRKNAVSDFDLTDYGFQIMSHTVEGNCIVYHPSNSFLNYVFLDAVRRSVTANGHSLIIAPSNYAVNQHTQFLKRHILSVTIGSPKDEKEEELPSVIIVTISKLSDVLESNPKLNFNLIIVLECQNFLKNLFFKEFLQNLKGMEKTQRSRLICFTSCFVMSSQEFSSIKEHIDVLEEFYDAKVAVSCNQNAVEKIFPVVEPLVDCYEVLETWNEPCMEALQLLKAAIHFSTNFKFELNEKFFQVYSGSGEAYVKRILLDLQIQMEEFGEFGGCVAALAAFRNVVRLYTFTDASSGLSTRLFLSTLICTLSKFRKILEDDMFRKQLCERAEFFSSKKIQLLLHHLSSITESHRALILVKESNKASILALILQEIVLRSKKYTHLKPELMINSSLIPLSESREDVLYWERNMEVYSKFVAREANILILSGEPQGLDIPCCDVVMVVDKVEDFSHFLQAKNHMKHKSAKLILLTDNANQSQYKNSVEKFKSMEVNLKKVLTLGVDLSPDFIGSNIFKTSSGIELHGNMLIQIIDWYCETLPQGRLSLPKPVWQIEESNDDINAYCATLILPRICPIRIIKSNKMPSWELAQQDAAFRAFQELCELNEISDSSLISWHASVSKNSHADFLASINSNVTKFQSNINMHLELHDLNSLTEESRSPDEEDILCDINYPFSLSGAQPLPNMEVYVHKINMKPVSELPPPYDNRKTVLYELLCDKNSFAILSTKPLYKVCQFPVFMFGHELSVDIETFDKKLQFDSQELMRLRMFHCGLFMHVLPVVQCFMQFDDLNSQNSYLIAPVTCEGNIDWRTVKNHVSIPECRQLTLEEKLNLVCTRETHERTIIQPWYRHLERDQVYLVSSVCTDMDADSCFPTDDFDSFLDYYREKYKIILERPELPLLEAYLINTKVNGLLPRVRSHKMRREEKMEEFREHMVPELCMSLLFPASYWLKLSCLPSVLHRLNRLLVAEELRRLLSHEAGAGALEITLERLKIDLSCLNERQNVPELPPSTVKRGLAVGNVRLEDRKRRAHLKKPWGITQEPVDIERHVESLNFVEIRYYDEFLSNSMSVCDPLKGQLCSIPDEDMESEEENDSCCSDTDETFPRSVPIQDELPPEFITLLKANGECNQGPQQHELLEVLTCSTSNDAVNMDRIQILGNAFLKLAISVYAYQYGSSFPGSRTSMSLNNIRSSFMSSNNLEQCALKSNLCSRLKVLDFTPGEWIPPCFLTPRWLKELLIEQDISPNVLLHIQLTEAEQLCGMIGEDSQEQMMEILANFVNRGIARREEIFIDRQHVPHQVASSCVEALVGTYFKNCGWQGALKIVGWLDLLPTAKLDSLLDYEDSQDKVSISSQIAYLHSDVPLYLESMELNLHYVFNDKALLVQAVTHESFVCPDFHGHMDSLAFLGSGILEFLITSYIFEHYTEMSPPHLWRLQEILTCTSTLAFLAARHDMHKHLLLDSPLLLDAIERFVKGQKGCRHPIDDEVQLLLEEHECESAIEVEVPDALAKLIPALVGAVYLDSGKNLTTTWSTFSKIFLPELGRWRGNVPLGVIDLLKDLSPAAHQVIFSNKAKENNKVEVTCKILMDNVREEVFVASGSDESKTTIHAAKLALRNLLGITRFNH